MKKITVTALLSALTLCLITHNSSAMSRMRIAQGRVPGSWVKGAKLSGVAQAAKDQLLALKTAAESIGLDTRALEKISNDNPGDQIRLFSEVLSAKGIPVLDVLSGNFNPENYLANQAAQAAITGQAANMASAEAEKAALGAGKEAADVLDAMTSGASPAQLSQELQEALLTQQAATEIKSTANMLRGLAEEEGQEVTGMLGLETPPADTMKPNMSMWPKALTLSPERRAQLSGYWDTLKGAATGALGYIGRPVMSGASKAAEYAKMDQFINSNAAPEWAKNAWASMGQAEKEAVVGLGTILAAGMAYKMLSSKVNLDSAKQEIETLIKDVKKPASLKKMAGAKQIAQTYVNVLNHIKSMVPQDQTLKNRLEVAVQNADMIGSSDDLDNIKNAQNKLIGDLYAIKLSIQDMIDQQAKEPSMVAGAVNAAQLALPAAGGALTVGALAREYSPSLEQMKSWMPTSETGQNWTSGWSRPAWLGLPTSNVGRAGLAAGVGAAGLGGLAYKKGWIPSFGKEDQPLAIQAVLQQVDGQEKNFNLVKTILESNNVLTLLSEAPEETKQAVEQAIDNPSFKNAQKAVKALKTLTQSK